MNCGKRESIFIAYIMVDLLYISTTEVLSNDGSVDHELSWSAWTPWSACSTTCGVGTKTRSRQCLAVDSRACKSAETFQTEECVKETCNAENKELPVGAFLGQPGSLHCPLDPAIGVKQLYWITPLGDRISVDSVTSTGFKAKGGVLNVLEATEYSSGTYHCVVIDKNDKTDTADIKLVVYSCGDVNPCMNGGKCVQRSTGSRNSPTLSSVKVWCECGFAYYGNFCQEEVVNIAIVVVGAIVLVALLVALWHCCRHIFWPKKKAGDTVEADGGPLAGSKSVSRPEPEGATYTGEQQQQQKQQKHAIRRQEMYNTGLLDDPAAAYDLLYDEDDDEALLLPQDAGSAPSRPPADLVDVAIQPSLTRLVPPPPVQQRQALSTPDIPPVHSSSVPPSVYTDRPTDLDTESYVDSNPLTTAAIRKLHRNRVEQETTDTSTDGGERRRGLIADSGRRFPPVKRSITPASAVSTADTLVPGRTSTSSFLFDSQSSDSDAAYVLRTVTLRSIAEMKRRDNSRLKRSSPIRVIEAPPEVVGTESGEVTWTGTPGSRGRSATPPQSVRTRSRSETPRSVVARSHSQTPDTEARQTPQSPALPTSPSPSAGGDVLAAPGTTSPVASDDVQSPAQSRTASPADTSSPAVPAPVNQSEPGGAVSQSHVPVEQLKDVQKVERTDADGRKTTVYKLTPNAGSMFPAPVWPSFGARTLSVGAPVPTASISLGDRRDKPRSPAGAGLTGGVAGQSIQRLKALASQRGETMPQHVLHEIQGVSARPQVRSADATQLAALRQPLAMQPGHDAATGSLQLSAPDASSISQTSDDGGLVSRFFYSTHQPVPGEPARLGVSDSLTNFPLLSGERTHLELNQRLTLDIPVPAATDSGARDASQFLQDRFNSQKKCFTEADSPRAYLNGVVFEGLQPETKSILNRMSNIGVKTEPQPASPSSMLQRIRSSFSSADRRLTQAASDYPQQPSSSRIAPADVAKPDEFLHPSLHRIPSTSRPDSAVHPSKTRATDIAKYDEALHPSLTRFQDKKTVDMAKPDEFLHPSLHRIPAASSSIPSRLDSALRPSVAGHQRAASDIARYDEALHPSLTRIPQRAVPDNLVTPSLSKLDSRKHVTFDVPSSPDEPLHPSTSRLQSMVRDEPAVADNYLHPSLTRVQPAGTGKLRTELEATKATTSVLDREYFFYDEPARPDDILHPSATRLPRPAGGIATRTAATSAQSSIDSLSAAAAQQDQTRRSSTQPQRTDSSARSVLDTTTSAAAGSSKVSAPLVTARPDDILHPSSTKFQPRDRPMSDSPAFTARDTLPSVSARPGEVLQPSSTQFQQRDSTRTTFDSAAATTAVGRRDWSSVTARPDDTLHPSSTQFARSAFDSATSTTALDGKDILPPAANRPDDILHPSSTQFLPHDRARTTIDSATSTMAEGSRYLLSSVGARPDDVLHPSSTGFPQQRGSARTTFDSGTSTSALGGKDLVSSVGARPDDILHPSSTQFPAQSSARTTSTLGGKDLASSVSARPDDVLHPSSTGFPQQRGSARTTFDSGTSTSALGGKDLVSSVGARPDDILHPSSTQFPARSSARTTYSDATSTTGLHLMEDLPSVSAKAAGEIKQPFSTRLSAQDAARATFDSTAIDRKDTLPRVSARPDDILHPSSTQFAQHGSVRASHDASAPALREKSSISTRPDDTMRQSSMQLAPRTSARATADRPSATSSADLAGEDSSALVNGRPDDMLYPSSTQFLPHGRTSAISTAAVGKDTSLSVSARPGDLTHPSTQFPARSSFDTSTSTTVTGLRQNDSLPGVTARPDDILHPSSMRFPARTTATPTADRATSAVHVDEQESFETISVRPDDGQLFPTGSDTGRLPSKSQLPLYREYEDRQSTQYDDEGMDNIRSATRAAPQVLKRISGLRQFEDKDQRDSLGAAEYSHSTELQRASLADGSTARPSSVGGSDLQSTGKASVRSGFQSAAGVGLSQTEELRSLEGRASFDRGRLSDRSSVIRPDHIQNQLPGEMLRNSMHSGSAGKRRTVSWARSPRAKSDVDTRVADSDSSVGYQSLPDVFDYDGPTDTSSGAGPSAVTPDERSRSSIPSEERKSTGSDIRPVNIRARDSRIVTREQILRKKQLEKDVAEGDSFGTTEWSDERGRSLSEDRKSAASDEPVKLDIRARDSRVLTREHLLRKKQQDMARPYEAAVSTTVDTVARPSMGADRIEDKPQRYRAATCYETPPGASPDRPSATRVCGDAAVDDVPLRTPSRPDDVDSLSCAVSDRPLAASVSDFTRKFNVDLDSEDWLLGCPTASLSRPPSCALSAGGSSSGSRAAVYEPDSCRPTCDTAVTRQSSICDARTSCDGRAGPTSDYTSPFMRRAACSSRAPVDIGRSCPSRPGVDSWRQAAADPSSVRTMRLRGSSYCATDGHSYQSPFARGYVPPSSGGSTFGRSYQPCQPSLQTNTLRTQTLGSAAQSRRTQCEDDKTTPCARRRDPGQPRGPPC